MKFESYTPLSIICGNFHNPPFCPIGFKNNKTLKFNTKFYTETKLLDKLHFKESLLQINSFLQELYVQINFISLMAIFMSIYITVLLNFGEAVQI